MIESHRLRGLSRPNRCPLLCYPVDIVDKQCSYNERLQKARNNHLSYVGLVRGEAAIIVNVNALRYAFNKHCMTHCSGSAMRHSDIAIWLHGYICRCWPVMHHANSLTSLRRFSLLVKPNSLLSYKNPRFGMVKVPPPVIVDVWGLGRSTLWLSGLVSANQFQERRTSLDQARFSVNTL